MKNNAPQINAERNNDTSNYNTPSINWFNSHKHTTPSSTISLNDLAELVERGNQIVISDSNQMPCITPHTENGKTKEIAQNGIFSYIALDFDEGNYSKEQIDTKISELGYRFLAHTTSSHQSPANKAGKPITPQNRWRVFIPIASFTSTEYESLAVGLTRALGADESQARIQQVSYAPCILKAGNQYQFINRLNDESLKAVFTQQDTDSVLYTTAQASNAQSTTAIQVKQPKITTDTTGGIIGLIKQAYSMDDLLSSSGYKKAGDKWLSPCSSSGIAGVIILNNNNEETVYSHHSNSDPLSHENHGGHALDIAGALCALQYNGDFSQMIKTESAKLDPEGQKERQQNFQALNEPVASTPAVNFLEILAQAPHESVTFVSDVSFDDEESIAAVEAIIAANKARQAQQLEEAATTNIQVATVQEIRQNLDAYFTDIKSDYIEVPERIKDTVIGKLAMRAAHTIEMPLGTTLIPLLAGASAAAATNYCTSFITGTRVQLGLYVVVEQPPSVQKGTLLALASKAYSGAIAKHNKRIYCDNEVLGKNSLPFAFNKTTDATSAALDSALADRDSGRFFIASSEQGGFSSLFPDNSKFASNNDLVLSGFQGEFTSTARKTRTGFEGYPMGSILFIAQRGSIQRVLNESNFTGLAERFLFVSEPTKLGQRTHENGYITNEDKAPFNKAAAKCVDNFSRRVAVTEEAMQAAINRVEEEVKANVDSNQVMVNTDLEHLDLIGVSHDAYRLIRAKRIELEPLLGQLNNAGELTFCGWLGKFESQTIKIAATLYIFDCLATGNKAQGTMSDDYISMAMDLVLAIGKHMRALIQYSGEAGDTAEIDAILDAVRKEKMTLTNAAMLFRNRKPFKNQGKGAYKSAKARIESMIEQGFVKVDDKGLLQPH